MAPLKVPIDGEGEYTASGRLPGQFNVQLTQCGAGQGGFMHDNRQSRAQ